MPNPSLYPPEWPWNRRMNRAAVTGDLAMVNELLEALDQDPSIGDPNEAWSGPNVNDPGPPLHVAIAHERVAVIVALARHPKVDVNVPNEYGERPLMDAVAMSSNAGPAPLVDTPQPTPEHPVGIADAVRALLEAGARADQPKPLSFDLPFGLGQALSVAERAAMDGGSATPAVLDLLVTHRMLDPTPDTLGRLLVLAAGRTLNMGEEEDSSTPPLSFTLAPQAGTIAWLLDHGASTRLTDPATGRGVLSLASGWRSRAPVAFARLEQAVLLDSVAPDAPTLETRLRPRL